MTQKHQFQTLKTLSEARLAAAQAEFAAVADKEMRLRENLTQLVTDRHERSVRAGSGDVAMIAGADVRWHKWVDARRAVINTELARVLAQKLQLRDKLRAAFGKDQALAALITAAADAEKRQRSRRA